ncbi:hypothetical protein [Sporolactobacillus nakayamae]|uniref:Uncharacterized protein n=1 Tax=Sporolactobacillus nakayamae TaxID=269670 RepID=A0A1I2VFU8_9BACL|nr:hypothetical protein [Sporolactobacillus nakayamae]SFG87067.1 hypothetical protein SAMN02982927_03047 [Sporolactobacillus nakayamae]
MTIERIFDNRANIAVEDLLGAIVEDKIDTLVNAAYCKDKVNSTDSSNREGEVVA